MHDHLLRLYVWQLYRFSDPTPPRTTRTVRRRDDRGEGIISTAIAVLIMAFLGVLVWGGFKLTMQSTQEKVDDQVEQIGQ